MNALELFVNRLSSGDLIGLAELPKTFVDDCQRVLVSLGDKAGGRHDTRTAFLRHIFTHKQYVREITMKQGAIIVSRKHKTQHPFIISKGVVTVFTPGEGIKILVAPFLGITEPNTKRLLFINEECVWTTIHPNESGETCPDKIVLEITEQEFEFEEPDFVERISQ